LKITTRLNTLLKDQRIVSAMEEAKATLGVSAEARRNSIELIDGAKKILDDRIRVAIRSGANELAKATTKLKNELVEQADNQIPAYKKARKIFSDFASLEDAQKAGLDFTKSRPEQLKTALKGMSNTEKEAFKIGVRENLQKTVNTTADTADPAKRIFGNQFKRDQLKAVFGEGNQFGEFSKLMREEIRGAKAKFRIIEGSRSDINFADDGQFIVGAADAARRGVASTTMDTIISSIADIAQRRWIGLNPTSAKQLAKILTDREAGIDALQRLIDKAPAKKQQKLLLQDAVRELGSILGISAAERALEPK